MPRELSVPSLFQLGYYWEAKIFLVSVKLDLYTPLAIGTKTAKELASLTQTDPAFLERLLSALVTMGLLRCDEHGYQNTPSTTEFLVTTSRFYMGELMLLMDEEWDAWSHLEEVVRSGTPPVQGNLFMNRPKTSAKVLAVLHRMAQRTAPSLVEKIDLSSSRTLLDVGGGAGTYSLAFCKRYSALQATLFDLPNTLIVTRKQIENEQMLDRIQLIAGDFNQDVIPGEYDVVFLSDILHYQTNEENGALISKLYDLLLPGGRIIVKDMFLNQDIADPGWNAIFSIHLMVYTERGRCFSKQETECWLEQAGFSSISEVERNIVLTATK